jgi:hypothetical protein
MTAGAWRRRVRRLLLNKFQNSLLLRLGGMFVAITVLAVASMSTSWMVAETTQGSGQAINLAGSLRMQTWRMASIHQHLLQYGTAEYRQALDQAIEPVRERPAGRHHPGGPAGRRDCPVAAGLSAGGRQLGHADQTRAGRSACRLCRGGAGAHPGIRRSDQRSGQADRGGHRGEDPGDARHPRRLGRRHPAGGHSLHLPGQQHPGPSPARAAGAGRPDRPGQSGGAHRPRRRRRNRTPGPGVQPHGGRSLQAVPEPGSSGRGENRRTDHRQPLAGTALPLDRTALQRAGGARHLRHPAQGPGKRPRRRARPGLPGGNRRRSRPRHRLDPRPGTRRRGRLRSEPVARNAWPTAACRSMQ